MFELKDDKLETGIGSLVSFKDTKLSMVNDNMEAFIFQANFHNVDF